jgi:hypothetical protein
VPRYVLKSSWVFEASCAFPAYRVDVTDSESFTIVLITTWNKSLASLKITTWRTNQLKWAWPTVSLSQAHFNLIWQPSETQRQVVSLETSVYFETARRYKAATPLREPEISQTCLFNNISLNLLLSTTRKAIF